MQLISIHTGRDWPRVLTDTLDRWGCQVLSVEANDSAWEAALPECFGLLLFTPVWSRRSYLAGETLWWQHLRLHAPQCRLLLAGYQSIADSNYLDLLQLDSLEPDWLTQTQAVADGTPPAMEGVDLAEKLQRFFAGHGEDSVVAVLSRLRLIAQMAQREVVQMGTPYEAAYEELIRPAQVDRKWQEWRNRWINYTPLFKYTPFSTTLAELSAAMNTLEDWMKSGGQSPEPIVNGEVLAVLNHVREQLQRIEQDYVVKELSYSNR